MAAKRKPAATPPKLICDDCAGEGCTWSDKSLDRWAEQTPWFDREKLYPKPPDTWRDRNCQRCQGAGYLDLATGEPLEARLIDSAARRVRRRRMEAG